MTIRAPLASLPAVARCGFVLPLVILGLVGIIFFMVVMHSVGSNYALQVTHVDEVLRCRVIAESAFATVLAKIREKPFKNRFFAGRVHTEYDTALFDGTYDLTVKDAPPPRINQVDIFVQARYKRVIRHFFWRIDYTNSLLDAAGRTVPILFAHLSPALFPTPARPGAADAAIAGILNDRKQRDPVAQIKAAQMSRTHDLTAIAGILNVPLTNDVATFTVPPPPPPPPPPPANPSPTPPTLLGRDGRIDFAVTPYSVRGNINVTVGQPQLLGYNRRRGIHEAETGCSIVVHFTGRAKVKVWPDKKNAGTADAYINGTLAKANLDMKTTKAYGFKAKKFSEGDNTFELRATAGTIGIGLITVGSGNTDD